MQRIIVINNNDKALPYGMGTYMANLIECLSLSKFAFDIVCINVAVYELKVVEKDGYREILIPAFDGSADKKAPAYCKMLPFILKELYADDDEEIIIHFNHFIVDYLSNSLKSFFHCKILFTVHYTEWAIELGGDAQKLIRIVNKVKKGIELAPDETKAMDAIAINRDIFQQTDFIILLAKHTVKTYSQISLLQNAHYLIVNNGLKDEYKYLSTTQKQIIRRRYHIKKDETILFFAGWLGELKGIYELIEAFQIVLRTKPDAHLFIAGSFGNFPELLKKARPACTKITFLGMLDKAEIHDFYRIADIGIVCSIYEEFGLVAVEMMMHQLPVVVTDTGGLAEIVDDELNGLKVPIVYKKGKRTVHIHKLAQKITFLIDHPDERKRLGENARKKFLSDYELSVFSSNMIQVYNTLGEEK